VRKKWKEEGADVERARRKSFLKMKSNSNSLFRAKVIFVCYTDSSKAPLKKKKRKNKIVPKSLFARSERGYCI